MADIQGIYNRLNSGSQYTPLSAETFGDWSMEAGDLVTVVKDGRSYVTPIMQGDLKWDGASKVTIESVGNRERESLGRMSRRKYSGGGGGYWNSKKAFTKIEQTDYAIMLEAQKRSEEDGKLSSRINVQAGRIDLVSDGDGVVTPASILIAINEDKSSTVRLSADKIELDGEAVADSLSSQYIRCNGIESWGTCEFKDGVTFESDVTFYEGITCNIDGTSVYMNVADVEKSADGKTLTITYVDGKTTTFSKAVTSATWAWSNGRAKVDLSPQGQSYYSPSIDSWTVRGNPSVNGSTVSQDINIVDEDGNTVTILNVSVNASAVENPISIPTNYIYTTSGSAPSGSTNATTMRTRILQAIADSETLVFRVDCGGSKKYYHMNF